MKGGENKELLICFRLFAEFFLRFFSFFKIQHYPIDTIAEPCRRRAIIKYMTQMRLTTTTLHFGPFHAMCIIGSINNTGFADRLIKAWPSAPTFKLSVAFEQSIATGGAIIRAGILQGLILTGPWPFGSFLPGNIKNILREDLFPLFFAHFDSRSVRL